MSSGKTGCKMCPCNVAYSLPLIFITILRIESVRIVKLTVPEVVQSSSPGELLECHYSVADSQTPLDGNLTVQWLFNRRDVIVQWSPGMRLKTHPRLEAEGRVDLSVLGAQNYLPLYLVNLQPELSGEYTCVVNANDEEVQATKPMLVFSPEEELELKIRQDPDGMEVNCYTRGVYPQPELTIEITGQAVPRQQQRAWREDALFHAESRAALPPQTRASDLACRLLLAPAGYVAIKKASHVDEGTNKTNNGFSSSSIFLVAIILLMVLKPTLYGIQ